MSNFLKLSIFMILIMFMSSCVSKKDIIYFQNDEIDQAKVSNSYKSIIKPDDLLQITVKAQDPEVDQSFNLGFINISASGRSQGQMQQLSYLVDNKGQINFPVLGKLQVGGLTRLEIIELLRNKLDPMYIKNPNIIISIINYKISVLGDVRNPGAYTIPNERITILEALALAGDLNISAQRDDILVQREENGRKIFYNVDLLSNKIFTSPVYYLQQNDLVYVKQNYASIQSASSNSNTSLFISISGLLITIVSLLIR